MMNFSHANAQPFRLGEGEDACLLLHGFTGSPSHMRPLGEYLASHGLHVEGIVLPGHGTRIQDMDGATWRDWLVCTQDAATRLKKGHRNFYVVGLSMGGVLSLILGERRQVDAVVSLAAPMRIYAQRDAALSRLIWPFVRYLPDKPHEKEDFLDEYDYGYDQTPVRRVKDLLALMRKAERGLAKLTCPLLVVQSRSDETVRPISADIIYAGANSAHKELLMLQRSPHVLTLGVEREEVFRRTADFLLSQSEIRG